jgi:hypothetical protein
MGELGGSVEGRGEGTLKAVDLRCSDFGEYESFFDAHIFEAEWVEWYICVKAALMGSTGMLSRESAERSGRGLRTVWPAIGEQSTDLFCIGLVGIAIINGY